MGPTRSVARAGDRASARISNGMNSASSIPTPFLESSRSLTQAELIVATSYSSGAKPGRRFDGDAAAAEAAAMSAPGGHYFPSLPFGFDGSVANSPGAVVPVSYNMPAASPPSPQPFEMSSPGAESSTMPLDDPSPFPLYVPGMPPAGYGVVPAQFEQPMQGPAFAGPAPGYAGPPPAEESAWARRRAARGKPRWSVGAESLFLTEGSNPKGPALIQQVSNDAVLLSASQLDGSRGVGSRFTVGRQHSERLGYEFVYSGLYGATQSASFFSDNNLALAGPIALASLDFYQADNMTVNYDTTFHNYESNFVVTPDTGLGSFVIGARFLYWKERFDLQSTDSDQFTSDYVVNATNRMYGGQVGWNGIVDTAWGDTIVKLRGGIFGTHASQGQTLMDLNNTFDLRPATGGFDNRTSYLGECSIIQSFNPAECVDLRIGYTMMWIQGLTRAPEQVDLTDNFDSGTAIYSDSSVFMHGFSLGATFSW
ncbi:MAG: hypothetical protein C0483_17230 [Pirellula sp.]|nr:hypothetical protein [Pirellula sp.]